MGVCRVLVAISESNLVRIQERPPLLWRFIHPDDPAPYIEELQRAEKRSQGFFRRWFTSATSPASIDVPDMDFVPGEADAEDLDKAWDGLNYLLTHQKNASEALGFLLNANEIGDVGLGYGPGYTVSPPDLQRIARELEKLDQDSLAAAFEPHEMRTLYPWCSASGPPLTSHDLDYLLEHFELLKKFVSKTAAGGFGLVMYDS